MKARLRPQLILGLAVLATLSGLAATVTTEVVMVPTSTERTQLIALVVSLAAVAVTVAAADGGRHAGRAYVSRGLPDRRRCREHLAASQGGLSQRV